MKVAVYSGSIPSTTFIERLIIGLAEQGVEILLHGQTSKLVRYDSKNIKVIGYCGELGKLWLALKYGLLLSLTSPSRMHELLKCYSNKKRLQPFLNWFVKVAPVVWHKPNVFHLQWAKSVEDWIFLERFGIKLVVSLRGAHINYSPVVDKKLADTYSKVFPKVNAFHGVSKAICAEAQKYGADPEKCCVVYSGLKLEEFPFKEEKNFNRNKINIISVGRPHWKKGYNTALDAMKILKDRGVSFDYRIIGGNNEELVYQIKDLGLKDAVRLEDNMPFEKVKSLIMDSDVLLMPSVEEGIPNVNLEAMALGTIVVSTDCGGVAELLEDGANGFLTPVRCPLSISNKIQALKEFSTDELNRIRQRAKATIEKQHNHRKMVEEMKALYTSVE